MFILRQFTLILLFVPLFSQICLAETLYERSLTQFNQKAQKASSSDYCFVVLGDSRDGEAIFKKALRLAKSLDPLFVLHGGDYSGRGGEAETSRFLTLVKETAPELPLFVVMGNHENRSVFTRQIGPLDFTLKSRKLGLTLVAVDNSEDALKRQELDYLQSQLSSGFATRFVAMHVPPKTDRWSWHTFTKGADDLNRILQQGKVQGALFSHVHLFDRSEFGGVPAFITGGGGAQLVTFGFPGQAVYHVLLVRVKNGKASFTMVPIPE